MFHHESRKSIYFGVRRSKIKVTSHENIAGVGLYTLVSAGCFYGLNAVMCVMQVPCDVVLTVKSSAGGKTVKQQDVFDVSPSRVQIPALGHMYAVVTFSPTAMQVRRRLFTLPCVLSTVHDIEKYWKCMM